MAGSNGSWPGSSRADFEAFCRDVERPLYAFAVRLVHDRTEAEDIVQEALLRLYRLGREGRLRREPSMRPLVFRIAHNLAMDHLRRRRREAPPLEEAVPAPRTAETGLLREQIDRALARLPENQRAALMLREFGGLAYAEIAATMGATLDQVKVWIHRARTRLADLLDRDGQYVGDLAGDKHNGA